MKDNILECLNVKELNPNDYNICDKCKLKIAFATQQLSWKDKLNPILTARKFQRLICDKCKKNIIKVMKG